MWRFGGRMGSISSSKTRVSRAGRSRRGGAERLKSGRAGRSGRAGLSVRGELSGLEKLSGRTDLSGRSGFFQAGFGVKGRASPVGPSAARWGGGAGRSSFFQAGRAVGRSKLREAGRAAERESGRASVRTSGRSKLRPEGRLKPKFCGARLSALGGRSSSLREKLRTGLGAEVRPASGRNPSELGRAGRKNLLASPLANRSVGRVGRADGAD